MYRVSLPFLPLAFTLSVATLRIILFSPSFLAVAQERFSLHSTRRIPLAFSASSFGAFTRTRRFSFLSQFSSLLSLSHRVLWSSSSLALREFPSSLLHVLTLSLSLSRDAKLSRRNGCSSTPVSD